MKCSRASFEVNVEKYEIGNGMEDGFERYADVITKGWIVTEGIVKITKQDGNMVCPYITHRRGITFIREGDYIITEPDESKHVCGEDKVFDRFRPVE